MLKVTKIHDNQNVSFVVDDGKEQTLERMHFIDYIHAQLKINAGFLIDSDLSGCVFINEVFEKVNFDSSNLMNCDIRGAKFIDCYFCKSNLSGCYCNRTSFINCDLSHSNLSGSHFEKGSLYKSDLFGSNISDVTFINTDLRDTNFNNSFVNSN